MFGSGAPSQQFSPPPRNPLLSSMKTEAYGFSFMANFAAKDSGAVNGSTFQIFEICVYISHTIFYLLFHKHIGGGYSMPPDNNLCAGNNQVGLLVNSALRVYSSTTGTVLKTTSFTSLFGGTKRGSFFDPVCVYDSISKRWVIVVDYLERDSSNVNIVASGFYVLASKTADLTGAYNYYYYELKNLCNTGQCFVDFPTIGMDSNAIW